MFRKIIDVTHWNVIQHVTGLGIVIFWIALAAQLIPESFRQRVENQFVALPALLQGAGLVFGLALVSVFTKVAHPLIPYVYFQF